MLQSGSLIETQALEEEEEEAPTDATAPALIKAAIMAEEPAPGACVTAPPPDDTPAKDAASPAMADQDAAPAVDAEPVATAFEAFGAAAEGAAGQEQQEQLLNDEGEGGEEGAASAETEAPPADEPPLSQAADDAEADACAMQPGAEGSAVVHGAAMTEEEASV